MPESWNFSTLKNRITLSDTNNEGILVIQAVQKSVTFSAVVNEWLIKNNLIDIKKSSYNSSIFMDICSVCKINKSIDTHHINYQSLSDDNGFFDNYHKNIKHNLVGLCKKCHNNEHNNTISIKY